MALGESSVHDLSHLNRHLLLVMFFLAIGVAGRETPEIVGLTEDLSNEGMVIRYEDPFPRLALRLPSKQERLQVTTNQNIALVNLKTRSCPVPPLVLLADTGPGLLHFLSVQRT
jgi:hypothetical protein